MSRPFTDEELARIVESPNSADVVELAHELQRLYKACDDARVQRAQDLVDHLLSDTDSYHNHKESMAYAGLLAVLALAVGILSLDQWPPYWVPSLHVSLSSRTVTFIAFTCLWLLGHIYIRWQLRYRRWAAITQGGALRALAEWVTRNPRPSDLHPYPKPSTRQSRLVAILSTVADFIVPFPRATLHEDVGKEYYPFWLGKAVRDQENDRTGATKGEWFLTLVSFLVLVLVWVRTFWGLPKPGCG